MRCAASTCKKLTANDVVEVSRCLALHGDELGVVLKSLQDVGDLVKRQEDVLTWAGSQARMPADGPRLASFWLGGLGVLSMTWLLGHHHRCMGRAFEAFIAADDTVLR